ncbi:hypothetical protein T01_1748 [Trichinella spiralis]|uniref:Secreted protein n=1 Tax=Trichinella spiralis TaxID=6334 RepID=A0A0V1BZD0_TRISP|nr:hypothetical protein T01_1748 [Trichinella spiralis]
MTAKRYGGVDCCGSPWLILLGRIVCCVEQGAPLGCYADDDDDDGGGNCGVGSRLKQVQRTRRRPSAGYLKRFTNSDKSMKSGFPL